MKCIDCGCEEEDNNVMYIGMRGPAHIRWPDCLAAALYRAEAAERRVAELEARLAALQAQAVDWDWQPTEQEWRSVTELPKEEDFYLTWDGYEIVGRWYSSYYEDDVLAWRDEFNEQQEGITHWRPLPPPPAATE
jgi:hypothetical protein